MRSDLKKNRKYIYVCDRVLKSFTLRGVQRTSKLAAAAAESSSLPGSVERNLAEIDSERFVALLCDKLNDVEGGCASRYRTQQQVVFGFHIYQSNLDMVSIFFS
jgi:hypothetical protein